MKAPLRFRWLEVRRMPGFPRGGLELRDLSPGVTLVHGANASGKSTAARALQAALWKAAAPEGVGVDAAFELEGAEWRVEVDAPRVRWQRDARESGAPPLPPADTRDRYLLSLHGLLAADQDDHDLAERIRVESAGGYDVAGAAAALKIQPSTTPRALQATLRAAGAKLREAQAGEAELRHEVAELARLREDLAAARARAADAEALRRALDLARARGDEAEAERLLAAFPEGMDRLDGGEPERLEECDAVIAAAERALAAAGEKAAAAACALAEAGLGDDGLPGSIMAELEERLEHARALDDAIARDREAVAAARAERERAGRPLGIAADADPLPDPSAADADALQALIGRAQKLVERRVALEERLGVLRGEKVPDADRLTDLEDAAGALREWLRTGGDGGAAERRLRTLVLAGAVALAIAGGAALLLGVPALGIGALVVAVVLLVLRPGAAVSDRSALERRAERIGEAPPTWSADAVEDALRTLEKRMAAARAALERTAEVRRLEAARPEIEAEAAALDAERERVAAALGLDPGLGDLALNLVASRLHAWNAARATEAARASVLAEHEADLAATLAAAASLAGPYAPADEIARAAASVDALSALVRDLRARRQLHADAVAARNAARTDRERAESDREAADRKRAAIFEMAGLDTEREHELRARADRIAEYREAARAAEQARTRRVLAEAALADVAADGGAAGDGAVSEGAADGVADGEVTARAALSSADRDDIPGLERALAEAGSAAEDADRLATRITEIETRLGVARRKHDVEEALAGVAAATAALRDQRDDDVEAEVGVALVAWLRARATDHGGPAVFERARELFGAITRHRYVLDLGAEGAFRARDTVTERGHALDELSSGTRLQLLLAVRVAFVETLEAGAALPLLLDEVLANSDEPRAEAIIEAAIALAREGRQLFYFTAQADELARWRRALEAAPDVDWCVRALDGDEGGEGMEWPEPGEAEAVASTIAVAIPAPDGLDHDAYGRALDVPRFDPWADGIGGLHLWYVVDDTAALHDLLARGITRWGQLERVDRIAGDDADPDLRALLDRARSAVAVCERFRELWRRGRGRPVDRTTLLDSGAISDTFIDRVDAVRAEVEGDAWDLLSALEGRRVERFQTAKIQDLRDWLREHGYLSDDAPLSPAEIRLALSAEADRIAPALAPDEIDALLVRLARGPAVAAE